MMNLLARKKNMRSYQAEDQLAISFGGLTEEPVEVKIKNFNYIHSQSEYLETMTRVSQEPQA
jgi:hypothetical protein